MCTSKVQMNSFRTGDSQSVGGERVNLLACWRGKNMVELGLLWWAEFSDGPQESHLLVCSPPTYAITDLGIAVKGTFQK